MRTSALLVLPPRAAAPKIERGRDYAGTKNERQTLDVYAPSEGKNHLGVVLKK
jgi:hypothetical protein